MAAHHKEDLQVLELTQYNAWQNNAEQKLMQKHVPTLLKMSATSLDKLLA